MSRVWWAIACAVGSIGCFTPPASVRHAERELAKAELDGAKELVPAEYDAVKAVIDDAQRELVRQESLPITARSYRRYNALLARAEEYAVLLREHAIDEKQAVRAAVVPEAQLLMATASLLEREQLFFDSPVLLDMLEVVDGAIRSARVAYLDDRPLDALNAIRAAQLQADELLRTLDEEVPGV